jgi:hypothetical protein
MEVFHFINGFPIEAQSLAPSKKGINFGFLAAGIGFRAFNVKGRFVSCVTYHKISRC